MLPEAAYKADISTIYALIVLLAIGYLGMILFWVIRSRTAVAEKESTASITERTAREQAELDEKRRSNELMSAMVTLLQNAQQFNQEQSRSDDELQRSYVALAKDRTGQINKLIADLKEQSETNELQREVVTRTESKLDAHVEASDAAIKTVQEIPTTLQRIEQSVGQLDKQLKAMPNAIQTEINPVKETVEEIKKQIQELVKEVRRIPDAIAPLPAQAEHPTILEAFPVEIVDNARNTPPPGALKAVTPPGTPPFTDGTIATTGEPIERLPQ